MFVILIVSVYRKIAFYERRRRETARNRGAESGVPHPSLFFLNQYPRKTFFTIYVGEVLSISDKFIPLCRSYIWKTPTKPVQC